jgi:hypothetical protein
MRGNERSLIEDFHIHEKLETIVFHNEETSNVSKACAELPRVYRAFMHSNKDSDVTGGFYSWRAIVSQASKEFHNILFKLIHSLPALD